MTYAYTLRYFDHDKQHSMIFRKVEDAPLPCKGDVYVVDGKFYSVESVTHWLRENEVSISVMLRDYIR